MPRPLTNAAVEDAAGGLSPAVLRILVDNHARFLSFLERRVGRRDVAEEVLQEAFVRSIARGASLRDEESAVAWFYRLLRNALVDHYRQLSAEQRTRDAVAGEANDPGDTDEELVEAVCQCVRRLVETLKLEYADAIRRVDLDGQPLQALARDAGITPGNAAVRLHRARQALRRRLQQSCGTCAEHGCYQCQCHTEPHTRSSGPLRSPLPRSAGGEG